MYTYQEVYDATKQYFSGSEFLTNIWLSKYTLKDKQGNYYELTPDDRIRLICKELTRIELKYDKNKKESEIFERIYSLIKDFKYFIPGGSIIFGVGNKQFLSSLGNCFVIGNETDSYGSICKIDEEQVQLMKRRGGVGHDLSHLREKGKPVNGCANTSTGSVSFAPRYSNSTREVAQDGRRGALMLTHHINHPDIEDFVVLKSDLTKVTGANISVKITDEFMNRALNDKVHEFHFPINSKEIHSTVSAVELLEKIAHQAWQSAEPGILFWDRIISESPADCYEGFETKSTNPCVTPDTTILTKKGFCPIKSLVGEKIEIWNGYEWSEVTPFKTSNAEQVFLVTFSNGSSLECTSYHEFILKDGTRKQLKDCKVGEELVSFILPNVNDFIKGITISSIIKTKTSDTYCLTDDKNHSCLFNSIVTGQCGELPLPPYDSCRLGHINLFAYIDNPFTENAKFNETKFKKDVIFVQRLMDNVIDLEEEKVREILDQIEYSNDDELSKETELNLWKKILKTLVQGRRTGFGTLGEADAIAALGLTYASKEANDFLIHVHKVHALNSYESSIILAKERGAFPIWNLEKERENPFIQRILNEFNDGWETEKGQDNPIIWDYQKYGRRNIANLTLAPTGTTSQLVNKRGISSGMEPVFEIFYKRRKKVNSNDENQKVDFVDEVGDKWQEYYIIHPGFQMWFEANIEEFVFPLESYDEKGLLEIISKSPYYKATANEIDVISKIKLQGEVQKWIDHSISITHNLPKETTEEQVYDFIVEAWLSGCKGFTVYRDGCRSGVLIRETKEDKGELFHYEDAQKRPPIMNCDIHRLFAKGEHWFVLIGLLNEKPYEIFAIKAKQLPSCLKISANTVLKGQIIKRKKRLYDLITIRPDTNEPIIITDILSLMDNDDDRSDTKRFSLELRHRINPKYIAETIDKQPKEITSFEKAITRVLKRYIVDGESSGMVCDSCGSTNVVYTNGCPKCKDCGFSKCG